MSDPSHPEAGPAPASVYLLAGHLDAALAIGEDLNKVHYGWPGPSPRELEDIAANRTGQRNAVERIRMLELMLLSRILIGREWAADLTSKNESFGVIARLYVSSTAILADAAEECADSTEIDFDTGDGLTAYVRSRGLIAADAPALDDASPLTVNDDLLVARRFRLGLLLDLVSTFLNALEGEYDLFVEIKNNGEPASIDQPAAAPA
jgi:hypothetical protein